MATPDYTIDQDKQTVAGQMKGLLQTDSPYMQQAKTAGQQYANKRGLLNSSLGAQASQNAAIGAALPVAQADANTHNAFASQKYGTDLQKNLNEQAQGFNLETMGVQQGYLQENARLNTDLQKELNQQSQDFQRANMELAGQIQQTQMELSSALQQGNMELANQLQQRLNEQQQQYTQENARLNTELQKGLNEFNTDQSIREQSYGVTANTQGAYLEAINEITNNAAVSINEIETSPNMTQQQKNQMIKSTIKRRDADLKWTQALYSNMPTWDMSWIDIESMPAAPGIK